MPKRKLNPALKRLIAREWPDIDLDTAIRLLDMGLMRVKRVRCAAMSRKPTRPCAAQALANGLCKNHGGAQKSELGLKNISEGQKRRWAKWRAENGRTAKTT